MSSPPSSTAGQGAALVDMELIGADSTEALGRRVAGLVEAGDLIIMTGDMGAGKTTLTRGIGAALGVRGPITSPTFVLARHHPHLTGGLGLIHVDAYRVGSLAEIDDLDLLDRAGEAVTVVEWGADRVEHLSPNRLHIHLGEDERDPLLRRVRIEAIGPRWAGIDLTVLQPPADAGLER